MTEEDEETGEEEEAELKEEEGHPEIMPLLRRTQSRPPSLKFLMKSPRNNR